MANDEVTLAEGLHISRMLLVEGQLGVADTDFIESLKVRFDMDFSVFPQTQPEEPRADNAAASSSSPMSSPMDPAILDGFIHEFVGVTNDRRDPQPAGEETPAAAEVDDLTQALIENLTDAQLDQLVDIQRQIHENQMTMRGALGYINSQIVDLSALPPREAVQAMGDITGIDLEEAPAPLQDVGGIQEWASTDNGDETNGPALTQDLNGTQDWETNGSGNKADDEGSSDQE